MIRCHVYDLGRLPYEESLILQRDTVEKLQMGMGGEALILLEHPHVITYGRNASAESLLCAPAALERKGIDFLETDRGGDATYHGPGQLVGYPIFKLESSRRDIRKYVTDVETALIHVLADFGIQANHHPEYRGVWAQGRKIASVGVRISRWVTSHGFALNVNTDLSYFSLIHPCGIAGCTMTSMQRELGGPVSMPGVKAGVVKRFSDVFGREMIPGDQTDEIEACVE